MSGTRSSGQTKKKPKKAPAHAEEEGGNPPPPRPQEGIPRSLSPETAAAADRVQAAARNATPPPIPEPEPTPRRKRGRPRKSPEPEPIPPPIELAECRFVWQACDVFTQKFGATPLTGDELDTLAAGSLPVARKYADLLRNYPEVMLLVAVGGVYWWRVLEMHEFLQAPPPVRVVTPTRVTPVTPPEPPKDPIGS